MKISNITSGWSYDKEGERFSLNFIEGPAARGSVTLMMDRASAERMRDELTALLDEHPALPAFTLRPPLAIVTDDSNEVAAP